MRNLDVSTCIAPAKAEGHISIPRGHTDKIESIYRAVKAGNLFVEMVEKHYSILTLDELEHLRVEESSFNDRANSRYQRELSRRNSVLTLVSDSILSTYGIDVYQA